MLSGVQIERVKPELQEQLKRYQREAADVLWQAFKPQIMGEDTLHARHDDAAVQELQQIAEMGRAITRMAEQQIELQRQQQALAQRLDGAAKVVRDLQGQVSAVQVRLGVLEERVSPASVITDAQASQISNRVKALAELLTAQDHRKNHYQSIFSELYHRFSVSSYKLVQQAQHETVLHFLDDWRTRTAGAGEQEQE